MSGIINIHFCVFDKTDDCTKIIIQGLQQHNNVGKVQILLLEEDLNMTPLKTAFGSCFEYETHRMSCDYVTFVDRLVDAIEHQKRTCPGCVCYINITNANNVIAYAACTASYITGAISYTIESENIIALPIVKIPGRSEIGETKIKILNALMDGPKKTAEFSILKNNKLVPQKTITLSLQQLHNEKYVTREESSDQNRCGPKGFTYSLSPSGNIVARMYRRVI